MSALFYLDPILPLKEKADTRRWKTPNPRYRKAGRAYCQTAGFRDRWSGRKDHHSRWGIYGFTFAYIKTICYIRFTVIYAWIIWPLFKTF